MESPEIEFAKELKKESISLTEFDALNIACQIRKNNVLRSAFSVNEYSDDKPNNLEAIGMALGYDNTSGSLKAGLEYISESLGEIATAIKERSY